MIAAAIFVPSTTSAVAGAARGDAPGAPAGEAAAADAPPLTLDQAMALALASNRELAAARLGRDVARARVDVAKERPNPEAHVEETKETPRDFLGLSLPIEVAGKRQKRTDVAEAEARTYDAEIGRLTAETRDALRRAFFLLAAAQRRATETEELRLLAERTRDAAKERFEAGAAPRLEALQADLAAASAENAALETQAGIAAAVAGLDTLLARPPGQPISVSGDFDQGELPPEQAALDLAIRSNSEMAVLDGRIEETNARVSLARAMRIPDPLLEGGVTHRGEPEFDWGWRAGVGIEIPVFTTHRAQVAVESATLAQLTAERDALEARIRRDVVAALVVAESRRRQYRSFRDEMIPRVAEVEKMAEDAYRSGQTGLVAMIQTLQTTRDLRVRAVQAGLDFQDAVADLERAIGASLP